MNPVAATQIAVVNQNVVATIAVVNLSAVVAIVAVSLNVVAMIVAATMVVVAIAVMVAVVIVAVVAMAARVVAEVAVCANVQLDGWLAVFVRIPQVIPSHTTSHLVHLVDKWPIRTTPRVAHAISSKVIRHQSDLTSGSVVREA